jgi:DNA-binding SARP family transcriptional activator
VNGILGTVQVRLFGAAGFERGDALERLPIERPLQLLVYLASAGDWVDRDRLAALFWPDHDADASHRNVRKLVHRLRRSPWGCGLDLATTRVRWTTGSDVAEFDRALAAADLELAHRLYRGELAPRFELGAPASFAQWLQAERGRRARQHRDAVMQLIATQPPADRRLHLAQALLALDPLDEEAALACAQAQIDLGQHAAAGAVLREHAARVGRELAIEPSARVRALLRTATVPAGAAETPAGPRVARDAFVGRRSELRTLLDRLVANPVVTLHGPGGIGKSRLARAAVERLADDMGWRWPPHWIALADVGDCGTFVDRLAAQLGISLGDATAPWEVVLERLHERPLLLVLDNAESVEGLSPLLAGLCEACTEARLLITSRVPLGLPAEEVLDLEGLPWPDEEDAGDVDVASRFDAVALFGARAAAAHPGFDLRLTVRLRP